MRLSKYEVRTQADALKKLAELVQHGSVDPYVRAVAIRLSSHLENKDEMGEIEAIFNAVKYGDNRVPGLERGVRYVADTRWADHFTAPKRLLQMCRDNLCAEDCLPSETLVVGAGYNLVPIGSLKVGDLIMGDGGWTRVTNFWDKGVQPILEFRLNNGAVLRCTKDHKVFRVPKNADGYAGRREDAEEVRAGELQPGDDLLTASTLPYGVEGLDAEKAWLLGAHIADGWVQYDEGAVRRVALSGLDGKRKEAQKARALAYCEKNGLKTRWAEKYLMINDAPLAQWLAACGRYAPEKRVPSLNFDERAIAAIFEGLQADADQREGIFSTTSPTLALQYRLMLRMQGRSAHIRRVEDHGGLGQHPIYRVTPRSLEGGAQRRPHARIQSISEGVATHTVDIETDTSRFYLPESDLVVHNCDGHAALIAALLGSIGFMVGLRAWGPKNAQDYQHVYAVVVYPKAGGPGARVIGLDSTVEESKVGWEPPPGRILTAWLDDEAAQISRMGRR
jgi:hypothetical protein